MHFQSNTYNGRQFPVSIAQNSAYGLPHGNQPMSSGMPVANPMKQSSPGQVAANQRALMSGDGRIQEADGGQYKFQSRGTYSLLKDSGIDLRGNFEYSENKNRLMLDEAGLTLGNQTLEIRGDGTVLLSNGNGSYQQIQDGQSQSLGSGTELNRQGNKLKVQTSEYAVTFDMNQGGQNAMNISIATNAKGVNGDNVMPTGLLGETFDADNRPQSSARNQLRHGGYKQNDLAGKIHKWNPEFGKTGYVETLYANILGRPPANQEEMFQLSDKITEGGARGAILHLMNSQEVQARNYSPDRKAEILYKAVFNRKATAEELAATTNKLNNGQGLDSVVDEMIFSQEYFDQYKNEKMPSALSNKEAIQTLKDRFMSIWELDKGRNNGMDFHGLTFTFNPVIHRRHLEGVLTNDKFDIRTKAAAKCVLNNEALFRELDAANGNNRPDDIITPKDFEAFLNNRKINNY